VNSFVSYLTELFERPFTLKTVQMRNGRWPRVSYLYEINPQLVPQNREENRKNLVTVNFQNTGEGEWDVDFLRGGSAAITGEGQANQVFTTVLDALRDFTQKHKPHSLSFAVAKNELRATDLSYRSGSRLKLYRSLIKRFAPQMGYKVVFSSDVGSVNHFFLLHREKP